MTFIYPAVVRKKDDGSFEGYFPDLMMCDFKGRDLDCALDDARESMYEWIRVELQEEEEPDLLAVSADSDIKLMEGEEIYHISIHYRFHEGWDE